MTSTEIISKFMPPAMLAVFLGTLIFFGIISVILNYHWTSYGINSKQLTRIRRVYFGVSALFVAALAFIVISYLI